MPCLRIRRCSCGCRRWRQCLGFRRCSCGCRRQCLALGSGAAAVGAGAGGNALASSAAAVGGNALAAGAAGVWNTAGGILSASSFFFSTTCQSGSDPPQLWHLCPTGLSGLEWIRCTLGSQHGGWPWRCSVTWSNLLAQCRMVRS